MTTFANLVYLIEQVANGLYILLAAGAFLAWRGLSRAGREYRGTQFELERDLARYRRVNAFSSLVFLAEMALVIIGIQFIVAPTLRSQTSLAPSVAGLVTDGIFRTPTPQPLTGGLVIDASGVQIGEQDPSELIIATPTLTPTPVGTIVPNSPNPIGCDTDNAFLQIPANGMIIFNPTTIVGKAYIDNFAFYRFELRGASTFDNFAPVGGDRTQPVTEVSALGEFVPSFYEPGIYQFRINVFDITNTVRASCMITIYISDPIPTPTPLGTRAP